MQNRLLPLAKWALIITLFAVAVFVLNKLPQDAKIVVHWDANGNPNGWMGKLPGLMLIPVVALFLSLWISALPDDNSPPGKLSGSGSGKKRMLLPLLMILLTAEILIGVNALGFAVDPAAYVSVALGVLFLIIGVTFRTLSFGLTIAVKTPLTLQTDTGSGKDNKLIRWVFVISGLCMIIIALAMSGSSRALGLVFFSIGAPLIATAYGFYRSRKLDEP